MNEVLLYFLVMLFLVGEVIIGILGAIVYTEELSDEEELEKY